MITVINYILVDRRSSEVLSTQLTDDGPVYHALSVHLSLAKLITRFDDRYAVAKIFMSGVREKVPEGSTLNYFWRYPNFLTTQCRIGGRKLTCRKPARFVYPF